MPSIARFRVSISGFAGSPGVNSLCGLSVGQASPSQENVDEFATQLEAMYMALRDYAVPEVTWSIQPEVDIHDVVTGTLEDRLVLSDTWSFGALGTGSALSRATHGKFRYRTDRIVNNRYVLGGIFFGPLAASALTTSGGIASAFTNAVKNAHDGLLDILGTMRLGVWTRPDKTGNGGTFGYVQSVSLSQKPAVLRSRRD